MHVRGKAWRDLSIAKNGYSSIISSKDVTLIHPPVYPLLIRYFGNIFAIDHIVMGLLISNISIFVSVLIFFKLAQYYLEKKTAEKAVFYFLIFPAAFYFTMLDSESLNHKPNS